MLFMYVHTHPVEKCLISKPEEARQMMAQTRQAFEQAGINILGGWMAPQEHTMFVIVEANDFAALSRALHPMTEWGTARIIPVLSMEQAATGGA